MRSIDWYIVWVRLDGSGWEKLDGPQKWGDRFLILLDFYLPRLISPRTKILALSGSSAKLFYFLRPIYWYNIPEYSIWYRWAGSVLSFARFINPSQPIPLEKSMKPVFFLNSFLIFGFSGSLCISSSAGPYDPYQSCVCCVSLKVCH